jgi:hypothetical protein
VKAQKAYRDANSGLPPKIINDIFKPSNPGEETKDELSIFSGKTHTVLTAKSTSSATGSNNVNTPSSSGSNKSRSSSDSPQLVEPDNPSFKGVHPSLVSELNVFNGFIKRQLENAYRAGGEVFGGGEPMVVDEQGNGGGVHRHQQSTHAVRQQHQQQQLQHQQTQQIMYQPDYQRSHIDKQDAERLEREREEAANREMERRELEKHEIERQELARQQQLNQQREIQRQQQQHEILRQQQQAQQQQQSDIRRQQEKQQQQQQMQDQYRQQLEVPQHQLSQQRQPQYHLQRRPYDHDQSPMLTEPDHGMVTSSAQSATTSPIRTLTHSQSQRNIHHAYQQRPNHHYQSMHHPDTAGGVSSYAPSMPAQRVTQRGTQQPIRYSTVGQQSQPPQQHSMYTVPPEYSSGQDSIPTDGVSYVAQPPATTSTTYLPPTPISTSSSPSSYVPHWPAGSYTFAMPDQQSTSASPTVSGSGSAVSGSGSVYAWASTPHVQTPDYQHQQYTPEGALRGIAADDHSLQETWQSYMNKVRTPDELDDDAD